MDGDPGWKALESGLRAITLLASALTPGLQGPDVVARLQDAKAAFDEALRLVEDAIVQAEGAEIPGEGNGHD